MAGRQASSLAMQHAVLGCDLTRNDERAEYMRAFLTKGTKGELVATPFDKQDSSMLANLVRANCLVYREVNAPAAKSGDPCQYIVIE